ncbi:hypothetical protein [Xenorhabdus sp. IM139775]|uniref:hypothetical protein n=1 Tax=Xenorhabdus sp. IM139775 TaxID=3025876 RepID=UPI0023585E9C|nr:hypothetical protein [Xenorhabdus sp. IM139775]MDC9594372.1 hypothetical protein [Xenorhabdus sp. IM139775]
MFENILNQAIRYSHNIFKGKTANISYYSPEFRGENKKTRHSSEAIQKRNEKLDKLQNELYQLYDLEEQYNYILSIQNHNLVGNCNELSFIVFMYLLKKESKEILEYYRKNSLSGSSKKENPIYIQIIATAHPPYNHSFVMISCANDYPDSKMQIDNKYIDLPENAWICDPWANIVCLSKNYNTQWKNKMHQWSAQGKCLYLGNLSQPSKNQLVATPPGDEFSPINHNIYFTIQNSKKVIQHRAIITPNGNIEIYDDDE